MEIKDFDYKVYENVIEITLREPIEENAVFEFTFGEVLSNTRDRKFTNEPVTVTTTLTPMYADISAVKSLLHAQLIDNTTILYNIRDASRFVEYITSQSYSLDEIPFAAVQYVKYRSGYESLLKKYSEIAELAGKKGQIGKVSFEAKMPDLKPLLDELKLQMLKWEKELAGGGKAVFGSAVKGIGSRMPLSGMPNNYTRGAVNGMARPRYPRHY